jgi:hypothetical protein
VSPTSISVVKPDGSTQAMLGLSMGNSTLQLLPSATSSGFVTISTPQDPPIQVIALSRALHGLHSWG